MARTQVAEIQELLRRRAAERLVSLGFERTVAEAAADRIANGVPESTAVGEAKKAAMT